MRKQITRWALLALVAGGLTPPRAHAMGAASYTVDGQPFSFHDVTSDVPLWYDIDTGGLGNMTHTQAEAMINQAFQQWQNIPTASLFFHRVTSSDVLAFTGTFKHVTVANVDDFLGGGAPVEVTTPVLLDTDGSITDHLFGVGASLDEIAYPLFLQFTENDGGLNQVAIVLNGRAVDGQPDPDDLSVADMTRATMRAIGESIGLADSDLNDELIADGSPGNNTAVPIMHPGMNVNGVTVPILGGGIALTLDDQMSASFLYPGATFQSSIGTISGNVFLADGVTGVQGIEVIARKIGDPLNSAVSAISGDKFQIRGGYWTGLGTRDPKDRGAFQMSVPPGSYTVEFRQLREPIGPRFAIFPLPGGRQFATATGATTDPNAAVPVTVTAGAATTVNLVAGTTPAPAPQAITAVTTPHDSTQTAQLLPLSATVSGHVKQSISGTPGQIVFDYNDPSTSGQRLQDKLEDLYALRVPVDSILTLRLTAATNVDLDLLLINGLPGGPGTNIATASDFGQIGNSLQPETLQVSIGPGTWYIGVDAFDVARNSDGTPKKTPQETDYTLEVNATPTGDTTPPTRPILNQFVLGNVTDTGADASWITDVDAATDALLGIPTQQEIGDPTPTKIHHVTATGLAAGTYADLTAVSQDANANRDVIPKVYFRTADSTAATGPAKLQAAVVGTAEDFVGGGVKNQDTMLVEIAIQNTGGPATNVQLSSLAASPGWKLAVPLDQPLPIGGIGTNGIALAVVRLVRDPQSTGPAPLATVTGGGTLAGAAGATDNFAIGP